MIALKDICHARIIAMLWISDVFSVMTQSKQFFSYHRLELLLAIVQCYHVRESAAVSIISDNSVKHSVVAASKQWS